MQVKERGVLSLTPSRFKRALALVFSAGALLFLVLARDLFFYNGKEFQLSYYLWSLALVPAIGLLIAFDLHLSKPAQGILSVFLAVISALPMFAMMEAFDVNTIFKVLPYARLFNVLMIWLVCWVLYSVFGRFTVALRVADVLFTSWGGPTARCASSGGRRSRRWTSTTSRPPPRCPAVIATRLNFTFSPPRC